MTRRLLKLSSAAPCAVDRKYEMRAQIERNNRGAILEGRKLYDSPPASIP